MGQTTNRCRYRRDYLDYESGKPVIYECPRQAITERGFCEFHDPDYWREHEGEVRSKFEEMVKRAQENNEELLCIGFNLPSVVVRGEFEKPVCFSFTEFHQVADFSNVKFHQVVDFSNVKFHNEARFSGTEFHHKAKFFAAKFHQVADFFDAKFHNEAGFSGTEFNHIAEFSIAKFYHEAKFSIAEFNYKAVFFGTEFHHKADFSATKFHNDAVFSGTEFNHIAEFSNVKFHQVVDFSATKFHNEARFSGTEFHHKAKFFATKFHQVVDFSDAKFHNEARFSGTEFHHKADFSYTVFNSRTEFIGTRLIFSTSDYIKDKGIYDSLEHISFRDARFSKPSEVLFDRVYLGRVSFINCNIERVNFRNVIWKEERSDRYVVFDEELLAIKANQRLREELEQRRVKEEVEEILENPDITLDNVLSVYRRLRENYDYNLKYIESGKFFVSEMEVRRLYREVGTEVVYNNWFRRNLSITNVYKLLCLYGESHIRPIVLMLTVILISTVLRLILHSNLGIPLDINTILGAVEDSVRAFFQMGGVTGIDLAERLLSIPILGVLTLSLRRKFERRFRH